jgi:glycosyltransferase involved in cell wall biosynthesis
MRIALNGTSLNDRPSGARNRFIGLYERIFRRLSTDQFYVFEPKDCRISTWFSNHPNVEYVKTNQLSDHPFQRYMRGRMSWRKQLIALKPDVFETYHLPLVVSPTGRTIVTIHDIRYLRIPQLYSRLHRVFSRSVVRAALEKSDLVITVSNALRQELLTLSPEAKVSVVHNGVDASPYHSLSAAELSQARHQFKLPERFLLSVGHLEKRKNYPRLIEAVGQMNRLGADVHLVIVGADSDDSHEITERIRALDLSANVRVLNTVSDYELRCLYRISTVFVMPSVYEGFGIPLLEAMAANCPVVTSNLPVFREIVGDQGLYFDETSSTSIAGVMLQAYNSPTERERLIDNGSSRIGLFSYDSMASGLERIYHKNDFAA